VNEAEGQVKAWTATALVVFSGGRLNMFFLCQPKGTKKKEQPPIFIPTDWIWRLNHVPTEPYTLFLIGVVYWSRSSPAG
jgi:hypothetical protein